MSLDEDIFDLLDSNTSANTVYPAEIPGGATYPVITYRHISSQRLRSHDGTSLVGELVQVSCWDTSPVVARGVAREVVGILEPLVGYALVETTGEMFDPGVKLNHVYIDVRFWVHPEEVAS